MMRTQVFFFTFDVSDEFLRREPKVADEYIAIAKAEIASRKYAVGPRGGTYRLTDSPLWEAGQSDYGFMRGVTTFMARREGRYVRPNRVHPVGPDAPSFTTLTLEVKDGKAILPNGQTVETTSKYVDFPVLSHD